MESGRRDHTQDWLVPSEASPPLLAELERKVEEAMAIARASENAVAAIGAAAIDAAEQARRAAELAEQASIAAAAATAAPQPVAEGGEEGEATVTPLPIAPRQPEPPQLASVAGPSPEEQLHRFIERADRVAARLRAV